VPEMTFRVRWPDGTNEACYSPSLVVKEFFVPGARYPLDDFVARSRAALGIASERVLEKYGFACSRALKQLARIEEGARAYAALADATVLIEGFEE